jgi:hypothetical protein
MQMLVVPVLHGLLVFPAVQVTAVHEGQASVGVVELLFFKVEVM